MGFIFRVLAVNRFRRTVQAVALVAQETHMAPVPRREAEVSDAWTVSR